MIISRKPDEVNDVAIITIDSVICGRIEIDESKIINFVEPLIGFENKHRFVLLQTKEGPMFWLQSIDDPSLAFCVLAPFEAGLDFDISIGPQDVTDLGAKDVTEIDLYSIMVLDKDPAKIRTNLRAPILISREHNKAKQIIVDDHSLPVQLFLKDIIPEQSA
ncbi:MAG: flagellar assembly protein FliW [Planctomycetes bacterium]|nr:flagellar assembly protein FliW [Planctomycetota bacterium]